MSLPKGTERTLLLHGHTKLCENLECGEGKDKKICISLQDLYSVIKIEGHVGSVFFIFFNFNHEETRITILLVLMKNWCS